MSEVHPLVALEQRAENRIPVAVDLQLTAAPEESEARSDRPDFSSIRRPSHPHLAGTGYAYSHRVAPLRVPPIVDLQEPSPRSAHRLA